MEKENDSFIAKEKIRLKPERYDVKPFGEK